MPFIDVTLAEGRTPEQLRALVTALTRAAVESIGAPLDSVRVVLREVPRTHFAAGDVTIAERQAAGAAAGAGGGGATGSAAAAGGSGESTGSPQGSGARHTEGSE